jgi:hydrogenase nickel incorporation protein HypA/HybF
MHEFSLITELMRKIRAIACEQGAARISGVKVKLGALAHISGEHFRAHFEQAAVGTPAEGARLDIDVRPTRATRTRRTSCSKALTWRKNESGTDSSRRVVRS